jgi:hypothetical protein
MAILADEWEPSPQELEYLCAFGTEQEAVLAIGYQDGVEPWRIGKRAGFSGGRIDDEKSRRAQWAAAASRKRRRPEVVGLQEHLLRFRQDGGKPFSVSWQQKKARLAHWVLHGAPGESIRATVEHNKMEAEEKGLGLEQLKPDQVVATYVARVGAERTREALELLGLNGLATLIGTADPIEAEARLLSGLNGHDYEERLSELESRA